MKTLLLLMLMLLPFGLAKSTVMTQNVKPFKYLTIEEQIDSTLIASDVPIGMRELIIAQAKHESGSFKSKLFRRGNNLFGMMHPSRRPTTSIGQCRAEGRAGYAIYATMQESVKDYLLYMKYNHYPDTFTSAVSYTKHLKNKKYFEADERHYRRCLESILSRHESRAL